MKQHLPTVLIFTILSLLVVGLSAEAIYKHHQDSVATVDTTRQAVLQRNDAVQALANEKAVNVALRSSVTTLTDQNKAKDAKLATLCAVAVNKTNAACK